MKVLDYEVRFKRRRYGRTTYTWAEVLLDNEWEELGDPWPGVNWPRKALQDAIEYLVELRRPANSYGLHPHHT